jgi:hypothetical protein
MSRTPTTTQATRYAQYATEVSADGSRYEITKVGYTAKHPINWIDGLKDRASAWAWARCQDLPVVYCDATDLADTNAIMELGVVFDPQEFEKVAYSGYVGYGFSMSDGYYAPIQFESWVKSFRSTVAAAHVELADGDESGRHHIWDGNDAPKCTKRALGTYADLLFRATR